MSNTSHAVIFDLDGTLVDTPRAIVETFAAVFAAVGAEAREASAIRATIGLPLERAFADLLAVAADDRVVTRCVAEYQALFRTLVLPRAAQLVFPGVADGLATLDGDGFALAVATSKFRSSADALLRGAGLLDRFAVVVGADEVTRPKPDPEMGHAVLRRLGIPAERAVMVGDTTHDLVMARAAGMRSIAVTYGVHDEAQLASAEPTWTAASFAEVLAHVHDARRAAPPARRGGGLQPTFAT